MAPGEARGVGNYRRTRWYWLQAVTCMAGLVSPVGSGGVVVSKLKCPVFLARDFQQSPGLWESGNPAGCAGFPSEVGKSVFGLFHLASFPQPVAPAFYLQPRSHLVRCIGPADAVRASG